MQTVENAPGSGSLAQRLFDEHFAGIVIKTDRLLAALIVAEWTGCMVVSLLISPHIWTGSQSSVHPHVIAAVVLGGLIALLPVALSFFQPGTKLSRHVIAAAQMLMAALAIHVSGGRIETHFLLFGSLAIIAFYRDWRVLLTASLVTAADHFARGMLLPQSIYGVLTASPWRSVEHVAWVLFSDVFLISSCAAAISEMRQMAGRRAQLEQTNARIEEAVRERTRELRESEERFRLFMNNTPIMAGIKDDEGRYVWVNHYTERIFDRPFNSWLGKRSEEVFSEVGSSLREHDLVVRDSGSSSERAVTLPTADGLRRFDMIKFPFVDEHGNRFTAGTGIDVTERVVYEEQLAAARDTALEGVRLKSAFLANVSHEIRTPMNGVIGLTNLLLDTELDSEQRQYAETVVESAESLLAILNDILDFSKIEAGKLSFETIDFDLRETLDGVVDILLPMAQKKGLSLVSFIQPGTPTALRGDPGRLRQVVMNLVSNAIKFTDEGAVSIETSLVGTRADVHRLKLTVRDTGIGIAADVLPRLFRTFSQADGSTTRRYGGTGLGLAISKQLAERMHGTIEVESAPGFGSAFHCVVELQKARRAAKTGVSEGTMSEMVRPKKLQQPEMETPTHSRVRILVADDNPINQRVALAQLKKLGYGADAVANGLEAIDALHRRRYDIVLMDCQMPEMDGYTATRAIRSHETSAGVPPIQIIALTASAMESDRQRCLAAGMNDFVPKPVNIEALRAALDRAMQQVSIAA